MFILLAPQYHYGLYCMNRLEQKANEARNYDIKIPDRKFIWTLLNNIKHHKYYKERIASFLTNFELNPNSITQRWLENKFYSLDDEKMHISRERFHRESVRFVEPSSNTEQNKKYTRTKNKMQILLQSRTY